MKTMKYIYVLVCLTLLATSCDDFLDHEPDVRGQIKTPAQVGKLLVGGYSEGNYALLAEMSSDNIIDLNAPNDEGFYYNLASFDRMSDEIFAWEDAKSGVQQDSPSSVWEGAYHAIAVANHALEVIEKLEAEGLKSEEDRAKVKGHRGEALLIRAYNHFVLVNLFSQAYRNEELSSDPVNAMGIPYVDKPEKTVMVKYNRGTVAEVYKKIEKDLEEGIPLINDAVYKVPKYHFNKRAAHAFAARFYLYKRDYAKVVLHANNVLGSDPSTVLRDWTRFDDLATSVARSYEWINAENSNNLMLIATSSRFSRIFGMRYGCTGDAAKGTIYGTGPTWSSWNFHPCYMACGLYYRSNQEYGFFTPKVIEIFEYTDKVAGIGYPHIVRAEFTTEETLLCRAEAYIYLNQLNLAVEDLKTWDRARQKLSDYSPADFRELTADLIKSYYTDDKTLFVKKYNTEKIDPDFTISEEQKPFVHCLMHFRRIETIFDGYRWFDVKRYGIEIERKIGTGRVETLTWDDYRRALQIPQDVISAGMEPSPRMERTHDEENVRFFGLTKNEELIDKYEE